MDNEERISLHGHDPELILQALLQVDPEAETVVEGGPKPDERCAAEGWGAGRVERCTLPPNHIGPHRLG
jgi:hypothetical protein